MAKYIFEWRNIFLQAVFGKLLFGEALALMWWLGASLIIFGLVFLNYSSKLEQEEKEMVKTE